MRDRGDVVGAGGRVDFSLFSRSLSRSRLSSLPAFVSNEPALAIPNPNPFPFPLPDADADADPDPRTYPLTFALILLCLFTNLCKTDSVPALEFEPGKLEADGEGEWLQSAL